MKLTLHSVAFSLLVLPATTKAQSAPQTETAPPPGLVIAPPLILEHHWSCNSGGDECPSDRWCDEGAKKCYPKRVGGETCNADKKCFSGSCNKKNKCDPVDNLIVDPCFGINACPAGQLCDAATGDCYVDDCAGVNCGNGFYCDRGYCIDEKGCGEDPDCPDQFFCDFNMVTSSRTGGGYKKKDKKKDKYKTTTNYGKCQWIPFCGVDDDCAAGEECKHGYCIGGLLANGQECVSHLECESGFCDEFVFENSLTNNPQLCRAKKEIGDGCNANNDCLTGICDAIDFECTDVINCVVDNQCPSTQYCDTASLGGTNVCLDKLANQVPCEDDKQCVSGWCNTFLFENSLTNNPDLCQAKLANGVGCNDNVECLSNVCYEFECRAEPVCTSDNQCTSTEFCRLTDNKCVTKLADGQTCTGNNQCLNNVCHQNKCRAEPFCNNDNQCSSTQFCNLNDNTCDAKLADGQTCTANNQCANNICDGGLCTSRLPVGGACSDGTNCLSGICNCRTNQCIAALTASGGSCEQSCECQSGLYCDFGHDKTCKPLESLKGHCHNNSDCASGLCHVFECPWGLCGTETCVPIDGEMGQYCVTDSHCASNRCRGPQGNRSCRTPVNRLGGPFNRQ